MTIGFRLWTLGLEDRLWRDGGIDADLNAVLCLGPLTLLRSFR